MAWLPALPVAPTVDHLSQAGPGAARCWDRCAAEWELGTGLAGLTSLSLYLLTLRTQRWHCGRDASVPRDR